MNPASLIAEYITLRTNKSRLEKQFEEHVDKTYSQRMRVIEKELLTFLDDNGLKHVGSDEEGTAYRTTKLSVKIEDVAAFQRHVIGSEDYDALDWRANKTAVRERLDNDQPIPPGLVWSKFATVGIRKG